jgi:hypothetical protein
MKPFMPASKKPSRAPKTARAAGPKRDPRSETQPPPRETLEEKVEARRAPESHSHTLKVPPPGVADASSRIRRLEYELDREKEERAAEAAVMGEMLVRVSAVDAERKALGAQVAALEERAREAEAQAQEARRELDTRAQQAESALENAQAAARSLEGRLAESEATGKAREKELAWAREEAAMAQTLGEQDRVRVETQVKRHAAAQEARLAEALTAHGAEVAELRTAHEAKLTELRSALEARLAAAEASARSLEEASDKALDALEELEGHERMAALQRQRALDSAREALLGPPQTTEVLTLEPDRRD